MKRFRFFAIVTAVTLLAACQKEVTQVPSSSVEGTAAGITTTNGIEKQAAKDGVVNVTPQAVATNQLYLPTDRPIKTARTGNVPAAATGSQCTSNTCQPGGCASCALLRVYLPLGAQVVAIRYYHTAQFTPSNPNDFGSPVQQGPGESAWAMMEQASQYSTPQNVIVQTVYHNRSHNRTRQAALEVDWQ
jgi:hypothetical protein